MLPPLPPPVAPPVAVPVAPPGVPTDPRRRADELFASALRTAPRAGRSPTPPGAVTGEAGDRRARRERVWLAVRERLPLWFQLRCGLEPRTLAALAVVLVVAAVLAAQHFWTARPRSVAAPAAVAEETVMPSAPLKPPPGPSPSAGSPPVAAGGRVVVDVSGKVRRPGVLRLASGSRVEDALRAAGGIKAGTDTTGLNRARVLTDGEQVVVGGPAPAVGAGGGFAGGGEGSGGTGAVAPVSLNSATQEQLDTLPGVGPVLARHIIDYRTQSGGFRSVDELREVKGIGDGRFADLRPLVLL